MTRRLLWLLLPLAGCATAKPAVTGETPIIPGEVIVRSERPETISTELLASSGCTDLVVKSVQCVDRSCKVSLARLSGAVDEAWTRAVISMLEERKPSYVLSVEPKAR